MPTDHGKGVHGRRSEADSLKKASRLLLGLLEALGNVAISNVMSDMPGRKVLRSGLLARQLHGAS